MCHCVFITLLWTAACASFFLSLTHSYSHRPSVSRCRLQQVSSCRWGSHVRQGDTCTYTYKRIPEQLVTAHGFQYPERAPEQLFSILDLRHFLCFWWTRPRWCLCLLGCLVSCFFIFLHGLCLRHVATLRHSWDFLYILQNPRPKPFWCFF